MTCQEETAASDLTRQEHEPTYGTLKAALASSPDSLARRLSQATRNPAVHCGRWASKAARCTWRAKVLDGSRIAANTLYMKSLQLCAEETSVGILELPPQWTRTLAFTGSWSRGYFLDAN